MWKIFYKRLPIGITNSPENFQQNMNHLFHGFKFIHSYIDDLLNLRKGAWKYCAHNLELMLNKMKGRRLKCNIENSFFGQTKMEYLVFWITRNGVKPINKEIEVITNMNPPNTLK